MPAPSPPRRDEGRDLLVNRSAVLRQGERVGINRSGAGHYQMGSGLRRNAVKLGGKLGDAEFAGHAVEGGAQ